MELQKLSQRCEKLEESLRGIRMRKPDLSGWSCPRDWESRGRSNWQDLNENFPELVKGIILYFRKHRKSQARKINVLEKKKGWK